MNLVITIRKNFIFLRDAKRSFDTYYSASRTKENNEYLISIDESACANIERVHLVFPLRFYRNAILNEPATLKCKVARVRSFSLTNEEF